MKTYENNMADQALVVRSLKVLENIDGSGIREIRQSVDTLKKNTALMAKQQEEYWKDLSADGVISSVEKQSLKREMENIRQSYSAVTQQAASFGYTNPILQDYVNTYNALRSYIYDTLKLFDDMSTDTPIEDRAAFNTLFSNYFFLENFILLAITKGVLDALSFRVLESLNESGEEGETALYHGGLYQYVDGHWKSVSTGNYKGARDELPAAEEDSFFLCSDTFVMTDVLIVNDEELYVNEDELGIIHSFYKGYIYYVQDGLWYVEEDKSNWRYAAAFADVLNVTGELPQIFQDALDNMQAQLDEKVSHYLGASSTIPVNKNNGDYFTYTGGNLAPWYKGKVYRWDATLEEWEELNPNNTANRNYYMNALADILASEVAGTGYFSTIFANAFFANDATLQSLSTKIIYLREGGYIQSDESQYVPNRLGLNIDYEGNIDANGLTHLGGKVAIGVASDDPELSNYDVVIGGNTKITGEVNATGGSFTGNVNATSGSFTGNVNATGGKITGEFDVEDLLDVTTGVIDFYYGILSGKIFMTGIRPGSYKFKNKTGLIELFKARVDQFMGGIISTQARENFFDKYALSNKFYFNSGGYIRCSDGNQTYNIIPLHFAFTRVNGEFLRQCVDIWGYMENRAVSLWIGEDGVAELSEYINYLNYSSIDYFPWASGYVVTLLRGFNDISGILQMFTT